MSDLIAWRLWSQDFRGARVGMGDPPPARVALDFPPTDEGRAAAIAERDRLRAAAERDEDWDPKRRAADLLLSIAPVAMKPAAPSRKAQLAAWGDALPIMRRPPRGAGL